MTGSDKVYRAPKLESMSLRATAAVIDIGADIHLDTGDIPILGPILGS